MCGICGQFNFGTRTPVVPQDVVRMTQTLIHRGPDEEGYYVAGGIGLGFRRLSIIDLSTGHQPMSDPEESVWVAFNGEIYNFKEIRRELESYGYSFRTNSDTEVIIHGYKRWGDEVLQHLNGMFGLAIWDTKRQRLMLARDRMGIKIVYYKIETDRLLFGSEIRPILAATKSKPVIDPAAIRSFLRYRYTPSPHTIVEGVRKLAAGTRLVVELGQSPRIERWWNFAPAPFEKMPSDEEAEEQLLSLYSEAVERHLISDVPVGLLLSGGVDSALLLGLMSKYGHSWQTYTAGYGTSVYQDDELQDAALTAHAFGAENTPVEISRSAFEKSLETVTSCLEEPVATSSVIPMYYVCQRAHQDVKVALMGQGPDELFGGYTRHLGVHYGNYWRMLPQSCRSALGVSLGVLSRQESIRRAMYSLGISDRLTRYQLVFSLLPENMMSSLFRADLANATDDCMPECWAELAPYLRATDELGGFQFLEIRSSLPDELLLYADKLSMAHSLELRVPYLDWKVVEYVERLNSTMKIRHGTRKWLHRKVARRFLSQDVLRRKKTGFATNVVDQWFWQSSSLDELLTDPEALLYRYLRPSGVRKLMDAHKARRVDNHKVLFSLVILEHVLRKFDSRDESQFALCRPQIARNAAHVQCSAT